jgi:hypothetical protein
MTATALSCKHLAAPAEREDLGFAACYSPDEFALIQQGFVPGAMEDKWFIYYDDDWLRFHRSWTGTFIYAVKFARTPDGVRAEESWANRNAEQYRWKNTEYDRESVRYMIERFLLKRGSKAPKIPTEYRVHVPLNGMIFPGGEVLPGSAAGLNIHINFSLFVGPQATYGNIVGILVLPQMPAIGETISLVGRKPVPASVPDFPTHLKVEHILPVAQTCGEIIMLMLEGVVLASVQEADVVAKHFKDGLGLDCDRY